MDNWTYYYKINPEENRHVRSNMLYTPMISPDGKTFCMNWDANHEYQMKHGPRPDFTPELIDFFFQKEVENLTTFKKFSWAPELLDIDLQKKQIFFKWYGETCNNIVYDGRNLDDVCPSWEVQLYGILDDIFNMNYYKMSLYPHCFYIDNNNHLHTFDFYGCVKRNDCYIPYDKIKGMVGPSSHGRFKEAEEGDLVNLEIIFRRGMQHYIKWPNNALNTIYNRLFSE